MNQPNTRIFTKYRVEVLTKICQKLPVDLTFSKQVCQIFVAFLENLNFTQRILVLLYKMKLPVSFSNLMWEAGSLQKSLPPLIRAAHPLICFASGRSSLLHWGTTIQPLQKLLEKTKCILSLNRNYMSWKKQASKLPSFSTLN